MGCLSDYGGMGAREMGCKGQDVCARRFLFVHVYCSKDGIGCFRIFIGYVIEWYRMLEVPVQTIS